MIRALQEKIRRLKEEYKALGNKIVAYERVLEVEESSAELDAAVRYRDQNVSVQVLPVVAAKQNLDNRIRTPASELEKILEYSIEIIREKKRMTTEQVFENIVHEHPKFTIQKLERLLKENPSKLKGHKGVWMAV